MASSTSTSFLEGIARLFWMMAGPAILVLLAYSLARSNQGWLSPKSVAYMFCLFAVVLARRIDPQNGQGETSTATQLNKFTVTVLGVGIVVWGIANLCGNYWPTN